MAFNIIPFFEFGKLIKQITGDVTITEAGVSSIGAGKVTKDMLASGIKPTYYVFAAGIETMTNGAATKDVTVTGVANTDVIVATATVLTGATPVTKVAYKSSNTITITLSGNATTGDKVSYVVLRATT